MIHYKPRVIIQAKDTSQTPRIANNYQKLRESHGTGPSLAPSEGTSPSDTLILDFKPLEPPGV